MKLRRLSASLSRLLRHLYLFDVVTSISVVGVMARADPPNLEVSPAVEIHWSSQANKLYQVMATENLATPVWVQAGSPVLGTGALIRKVLLQGDALHRYFRVQEVGGTVTNWLEGLSEVDFRPASLTAQEGGILAEGLRATAVGITREDLLSTRFQFDFDSQSLKLVQYEVVPRIGVFAGHLFAKDVTQHPTATIGNTAVTDYVWLSLSGTNIELQVQLEPGQVFNFGVMNQTREHSAELLNPQGERMAYALHGTSEAYVQEGTPILRAGTYVLRLRPYPAIPATGTLTCRMFFANSNASRLRDVVHGELISTVMRQNTHDYAKFRVSLRQGQVLRLPDAPVGVGLKILDGTSAELANSIGLPMIFEAPKGGLYYLFVYRVLPGSGDLSYRGSVSITDD